MNTSNTNLDSPLQIKISFHKVIAHYEKQAKSENVFLAKNAKNILREVAAYPELKEGFFDLEILKKLKFPIQNLLHEIFPNIVTTNEIKALSIPFHPIHFNLSKRYQNIIKNSEEKIDLTIRGLNDDETYIMSCCIILNMYYKFNVDMKRILYRDIPDARGIMKHYRLLYNADFLEIIPTKNAIPITEEDKNLLLNNFDNIEVWKEKFPPQSYISKGFGIEILFDTTIDVSISDLKTGLINKDEGNDNMMQEMETVFQGIFNIPDLRVGFTSFNANTNNFETIPKTGIKSFILNKNTKDDCETSLCKGSFNKLFNENKAFIISDNDWYYEASKKNKLSSNFKAEKVQSYIIAPLVHEDKIMGVIELTSNKKYSLNTVNATKLDEILPFIVASVKRSIEEMENQIEALIQKECTAIHNSVYWRFQEEAIQYIRTELEGNKPLFKEIVFENVYPLYGQIDIKGSSNARNSSIQKDLTKQLLLVKTIIKNAHELEGLPIYEELIFRVEGNLNSIKNRLNTDAEQNILDFLKTEIHPVFLHFKKLNDRLKSLIQKYNNLLDPETGIIYNHRKDYDESVMTINKYLAEIIDKNQHDAQIMYPHYFERYKTDGIDHNIYIGESITKQNSFNKIYLYNLRLWQLQVMCEMENEFYNLKPNLPVQLDVASLLLVYNTSLSIRFRMDEKIFDVDGTYNARYEIIKKRVDKAYIKGTQQRITQKGKIAIVYSQKKDEVEYNKYIKFLQVKKYLDKKVEYVEVEDLQGVTGLKAILVSVRYTKKEMNNVKEFYTYNDLMATIKA